MEARRAAGARGGTVADEGRPATERPSAGLVQALLGPLEYQALAQAAVNALPGEFPPADGVLGALLCTVEPEAHLIQGLAFTRGEHQGDIDALLGGRPLWRFGGDYRHQANLIQQVAVQGRPIGSRRLADFLAPGFDPAAVERLERLIGWQGGLAVPIPVQQRGIGVLLYALRKPPEEVGAAEREHLEQVAHLIGLALEQARLYEREHWRAREMAAVQRVLQRLSTADDAQAVLDEILTAAFDVLGADYAGVNTVPTRPGEQRWGVRRGYRSEPEVQATRYPPGTGFAGRAMATKAPVVAELFGEDANFPPEEFPVHVAEGMQSGLGVPLLRPAEGGRAGAAEAFGALTLGFRTRRHFRADQLALAGSLAQHAAVALERARLLAVERRRAAELEATFQTVEEAMALYDRAGRPVRINQAMARLLGTPNEQALGLSPEERAHRLHATGLDGTPIPADQLPIPRALRGETVRALLRLQPAGEGGEAIDCEAIATPLRQRQLADGDVGDGGAVLVLRNIGPELRRRHELEALIAAGRQVSAEIDPSAVLRAIAAAATETVQAGGAAVAVVEEVAEPDGQSGSRLVYRESYHDHTWQLVGQERRPWEGLAGRALATGQVQVANPPASAPPPVAAPAAGGEPAAASADGAARQEALIDIPAPDRARAVIAVPIRSRGQVLAVVVLLGKPEGRPFDDEDARVLRAFAEQAATALENARLYAGERRARQELEQAQEQGQAFLSLVAHELKTPLTNIQGYAQLVDRFTRRPPAKPAEGTRGPAVDPTERVLNAAQKIVDNTRRLQTLVEDLQEAFRLGSGRFPMRRERMDLGVLARQVVEEQQAVAERHQLSVSVPAQPVEGEWDADRLRQMLTNLVSNAVKYSPEGGPVKVALRRRKGQAVLTVADQGLGVPREAMDALFQPYSRLHRSRSIKGTGLGLYIVKGIVEAHGGRVAAASAGENAGATFTVTLPLEEP